MRGVVRLAAFAGLFATSAHAFSGGVASTSFSPSTGCNSCHSGGNTPTVTFRDSAGTSVSSVQVTRGSSVDLWFRVAGGQTNGGFNVSRTSGSGGSLSANDPGVQTILGNGVEVTHTARRPYTNGYAQFGFRFTTFAAATCNSTTTFIGWGDSSNGNGSNTGDRGASSQLTVTVTCAANGTACTTGTSCASGFCVDGVCCNSSCSSACDSCSAAKKASGTGSGTCGPSSTSQTCGPGYRCNGTSTSCPTSCTSSTQCAGGYSCFAGTCQLGRAIGETCSNPTHCLSGFCVDGVCCNTDCTAPCGACSAATKESGTQSGMCGPAKAGTGCSSAYVCNGSSVSCPTSCLTDGSCQASHYCQTPCRGCVGTCTAKKAIGSACIASNECGSGFCADGYCCSSACSGSCDACSVARGSVANGTCTVLPSTAPGNPSCFPYRCTGTSGSCTTSCAGNASCSSGAYCDVGSGQCVGTLPNGSTCGTDSQCTSGHCSDGYCCDLACDGACDTCAQASGASANGACTNLPTGTSVAACGAYLCSGTSACESSCTSSAQCATSHYCRAGSCVPKLAQGSACASAAVCATGHCVEGFCCDEACDEGCETCDAAKGASANGTCTIVTGPAACTPYVCSGAGASCPSSCAGNQGCVSTHYCAAGSCLAKKSDGATCAAADECQSGHCADGRCCDQACGGQCEACDLAGLEGACSPVTGAPTGGRAPCVSDGSACGGRCDGVDRTACVYPTSSTACRAAACVSDTVTGLSSATLAAECDGAGSCPPAQVQSCGAYACNGVVCNGDCTADPQCAGGHYCSAGVCTPKLAGGQPCQGANTCASGHCVDGYCCDEDCEGQCEACDLAGLEGTCSATPEGQPRGARSACPGAGACQGKCDGAGRTACVAPQGSPETCNGADDDCDGEVDEGAPCPEGTACQGAAGCQAPSPSADAGEQPPGPTASGCGCATGWGPAALGSLLLALLGLRRVRRRP